MLLTLDIGNTSVHGGIFDKSKLVSDFREKTIKQNSAGIYAKLIEKVSNEYAIEGVVIGSVVPELDTLFIDVIKELIKTSPLFVSTKLSTGITNLSGKDTSLGADRLADIVAAINQYSGNRIIVDLGTATKFEVISQNNEYLGGAIAPGFQSSFDALIQNASKLSAIKLTQPTKVTGGLNTEEHLRSGFIFGFASLIDGMVQRIIIEQQWANQSIILTGGYSEIIYQNLSVATILNTKLTLEGLRILWEKNRK